MGKAIAGLPEAPALTEPEAAPPGIGAYLSRQRRLRGISLEELETLTHIPRRSLERLEAGVYDAEPDGFVRGFVRTVSGAIGLDPEDAVSRMLAEPASEGARRRVSPRRVLIALGFVLAAAGLVALAPGLLTSRREAAVEAPAAAPLVRRDAVRALAESVGALPPANASPPSQR